MLDENTKFKKQCGICKGKGVVTPMNKKTKQLSKRTGKCYYCRGTGVKTNPYGRNFK